MIELRPATAYEDACKVLNIRPVANYKSYKLSDETRNFIKLETIAKALNESWNRDLDNLNTSYCIHGYYANDKKPKGILYLSSNYDVGSNNAFVGVPLALKDRETAKKFLFLCKPMIVKHLFGSEDYGDFELHF